MPQAVHSCTLSVFRSNGFIFSAGRLFKVLAPRDY